MSEWTRQEQAAGWRWARLAQRCFRSSFPTLSPASGVAAKNLLVSWRNSYYCCCFSVSGSDLVAATPAEAI